MSFSKRKFSLCLQHFPGSVKLPKMPQNVHVSVLLKLRCSTPAPLRQKQPCQAQMPALA